MQTGQAKFFISSHDVCETVNVAGVPSPLRPIFLSKGLAWTAICPVVKQPYAIPFFPLALLASSGQAKDLSFTQDVKPILSDRCFHCHGPDAKNQKSEFRLDTEEKAFADLGGYFGIKPGDLEKSELHWRIHTDDVDDVMPPKNFNRPLTDEEKKVLDDWIKQGAKYESHWSFLPLPKEVEMPDTGEGWARNAIDRFVFAGLQERGLRPSGETAKGKWLRRVTFDLTGLPPALEELDAFLADGTPDAYEKVVDRLLDSDAYAERLASEWLDVARYSDTYGYQQDRHREVWQWRDWVIGAFRKNMPFHQFITEQLAGDLLPDATPGQILATTFSRLHPQKVEGGSVPEEFRIEYVTDRVETVGTAFLGLTLTCSRCHNHKYDPVTMEDYYSLSAFFSNIDEAGLYSFFTNSVPTPTLSLPTDAQEKQFEDARKKVAAAEKHLKEVSAGKTEGFDPSGGQVVHLNFEKRDDGKLENLADGGKPASSGGSNKQVAGKVGHAFELSGDDAVNLPKGTGNFSREMPFSYALWMKVPAKIDRAVVVRRSKAWTDAASRGYELLIEDGKASAALIHFWPGNAIRVITQEELPVGKWIHLAVTYDGSSKAAGLKIYLDGKQAGTEVVRDQLTREITGGGDDFVGLGQRMRDKGFKGGQVDEFRVYSREISAKEVSWIANADNLSATVLKDDPGVLQAIRELQSARAALNKVLNGIPEIMVMREMQEPRPTFVLHRGEYDKPRQQVFMRTPKLFPPMDEGLPQNRLGLAKWLTSPDHPLAARVTVNRYWQLVFGNGLVRTPEDFGSQGKPPTHPELLDWLSRDFVDKGWDLNRLLKQMVLSATYRQSSDVSPEMLKTDPTNLYLGRSPSHQLTAEMIRDNALASSGLLSRKVGGKPVRPYDLKVSFKPMNPDKGEGLYRRSLYTYWKRTAPAPVMMTLDASKREVCRVKRERTASPLQGLVLLNSPQFVEAARATAENLVKAHGEDTTALAEESFRLFTSRDPDAKELEILGNLWDGQYGAFSKDHAQAKRYLSTGDRKPDPKLDPARLAATTALVSALMNFDETITKR